LTYFSKFDILDLRVERTELFRGLSTGKEKTKKKGKNNEKKTYFRRCAHPVRDNAALLRLQIKEE
jgi:hypothetical protein